MNSPTKAPQVNLSLITPPYCRVVLDNPPLNLMGPEFVLQMREIITELENDDRIKIVVFESAVDGFFLNHSESEQAGTPAWHPSSDQRRRKGSKRCWIKGSRSLVTRRTRLGFHVGQPSRDRER
jgi:enoyl-CoA hydratase/carnithine racemase